MNHKEMINKVSRALLSMQRFNWEQGVAAQAFLELGDTEMAILFAKEAVLRQDNDGRLAMIGGGSAITDPASNGEAVLFAAKLTGDADLAAAGDKMLYYLINKAPRNEEGTFYHLGGSRQIWVDSFYMAPPFLAAAGHFEEAVKQIEGFRKVLWNSEKKLYSHIWDEDKNDFESKAFWGVGNGWAAAGLTRVVKALPKDMNEKKQRLIAYLKELIDSCISYQREDGLFHNVLDDSDSFVETNFAQMLGYSIYSGINGGWLERKYLKYSDKMREAVYQKVDQFGLVQGVCGAPYFESPGVAAEGQAFFLLMEAAAKELYAD